MPKSAARFQHIVEKSWQQQLAQAITRPTELLDILGIDPTHFPDCDRAVTDFSLRVPHSYVNKMRYGDPHDPLLMQVMASSEELKPVSGFSIDPVGDLDAMPVPGLLHKYPGRVLLVTTGACAVHCRYCFRRHFPYADNQPGREQWQPAMDYIASDTGIREVILSGGDPLVLGDGRIQDLLDKLQGIHHVTRLRIHSRLPVVLPARLTDRLIAILGDSRLQCSIVVHANHASEITDADVPGLHRLAAAGITLLNQAVLLRGINDSVASQAALSERLYQGRILPYYLHLLDPVQGAAHFNVDEHRAGAIVRQMREQLPGYLVPRLVREDPGEKSKTPLFGL